MYVEGREGEDTTIRVLGDRASCVWLVHVYHWQERENNRLLIYRQVQFWWELFHKTSLRKIDPAFLERGGGGHAAGQTLKPKVLLFKIDKLRENGSKQKDHN